MIINFPLPLGKKCSIEYEHSIEECEIISYTILANVIYAEVKLTKYPNKPTFKTLTQNLIINNDDEYQIDYMAKIIHQGCDDVNGCETCKYFNMDSDKCTDYHIATNLLKAGVKLCKIDALNV